MAKLVVHKVARDAMADAVVALLEGGTLGIYTKQKKLLASLPVADATGIGDGMIEFGFNPVTVAAGGDASFAVLEDSSGKPAFEFDVGRSGATLNVSVDQFVVGGEVSISSFVLTIPS